MSVSEVLLKEHRQAVIKVTEQLAVIRVTKREREPQVRGNRPRRRLVIKEDEGCSICVTHTDFDVNVWLAFGQAIVEDAKVCGLDSSIYIVKYLDTPDVPARPIDLNVVRLQNLRKVPSQRLLDLRDEPMTYKTLLLRPFRLPNEKRFNVIEARAIRFPQFLEA
jgi:hypothetical protein